MNWAAGVGVFELTRSGSLWENEGAQRATWKAVENQSRRIPCQLDVGMMGAMAISSAA